jgi:hypothetical protein
MGLSDEPISVGKTVRSRWFFADIVRCKHYGKNYFVARWRRVLRRPPMTFNSVRRVASRPAPQSIRWLQFQNLDGVSMIDKSMTGSYQINLPKDLLSEARKQPKPKKEHLKVEGWRTSWLTRVSEMLVGKD